MKNAKHPFKFPDEIYMVGKKHSEVKFSGKFHSCKIHYECQSVLAKIMVFAIHIAIKIVNFEM